MTRYTLSLALRPSELKRNPDGMRRLARWLKVTPPGTSDRNYARWLAWWLRRRAA